MKKLIIIGLIGAVALLAIGKKTNVFSYASTLAAQVTSETQKQIPTKFELERIRQEVAGLDADISQMIRPIAEYKVVIEKLRKDIARGRANVEEQKKTLLAVVEDLQTNPKELRYGCKVYSADRVRHQLQRDLDAVKRIESDLKTKQRVMEAKEQSLKATQEQLAKVISKKREYELRLAQLEAEDETLQIIRIGSDIKIDSGRASQIETALANLEDRLNTEKTEAELRISNIATVPLHDRNNNPVDLQTMRNYLEGNAETSKTAQNK